MSPLAQSLIYQLPYLLVYGIGLVMALVHIGRHPTPALLVLLGCGLVLLLTVVSMALPFFQRTTGSAGGGMAFLAVLNVLRAVGVGLIIAAAFAGRSAAAEHPFERREM